ncbi:MAG: hypothetical protein BGO41_10590 [Clostridiales bacterium 38-18]|nr:MAG: hypothetical protein BGO41_10590 [Clostridiales bacterium 38-18]
MKKILLLIITITLLSSLFIINNFGSKSEDDWIFFDDSQYQVFSTSDNEKILTKILQDKDYLEIMEQLIDFDIKPMTSEELKKIKEDKDAYLPDNILPDGRYLKENWVSLQNELIKEKTKSFVFGSVEKNNSEVMINVERGTKVTFEKVSKLAGDILVPISSNLEAFNYSISKNGKKTFFAGENGLYVVDPQTNNVKELSKIDDLKYRELVEKSFKKYNLNTVFANSAILPSDDGSNVIFLSNRDSFDENINEIYLSNVEDGNVKVLKTNKKENYYPQSWLDDRNILFSIIDSSVPELSIIDIDQNEINLGIRGFVLSVSGHYIAYTEELGGNVIHIIKFNENKVEEVGTYEIPGNIVSYQGFNGFSPNNDEFVVIYSPQNDSEHVFATLLDIKSKTNKIINNLPNDGSIISSCDWIDNKSIMMTIGTLSNNDLKTLTNSTWIYNIKGEK